MQTFIPEHATFTASARTLDRARLGKQRVECLQIVNALTDPDYGWQNHPAVRMWEHHQPALVRYSLDVIAEWTNRGYRDTCAAKIIARHGATPPEFDKVTLPDWWGTPSIHESHRANLVRKDPDHYLQFWPGTKPAEGYVWPTDVERVAA